LLVTRGAYPTRKHMKGAPILGGSGLALKLRPYWKGFPRTNPLAY